MIVTVSLGVLKGGAAALFTPPLPAPKLAAIQDMHIGIVNKVGVCHCLGRCQHGCPRGVGG